MSYTTYSMSLNKDEFRPNKILHLFNKIIKNE